MNLFCDDRDLLALEEVLFLGQANTTAGLIGAGGGGTLGNGMFTATNCDFAAAGVQAGMVLTVYGSSPAEGLCYEILAVAPTQLQVSVLRADVSADAIAPANQSSVGFFVRTYRPQIRLASDALAEKLRRLAEASGVRDQEFAPSAQLRQAAAVAALAAIFTARSDGSRGAEDIHWIKARHYREELSRLQPQLRLSADLDGDGIAEHTRSLGNVTLRRV